MQSTYYDTKEEWEKSRAGKITGTRLKDIVARSCEKKIGYYKLIAEKIAISPDGENAMERGVRLEPEALIRFEQETGKEVYNDLVIWSREDVSSIAISPDAYVDEKEAVEVKCLSSERHIEAYLKNNVPAEYRYQTLQYFVVNDDLEKLNVVFYDPRIPVKDYFVIEIIRSDVADEVQYLLDYQKKVISEVNEIVNDLTF